MSDFSIIASHPNVQEIITKLMSGSSPKAVAQWLKLKYNKPEQSHLRITQKLLKEFSDSPLTDLYKQVQKDRSALAHGGNISAALANNKPYRERILETVGKEVDIINLITNLVTMCYQRMEQVFDVIQEDPRSFKGDNYLLRYLTELSAAAERLEKLRLGSGDQLVQHNVTMEAVAETSVLLQEVVREVLAEIDPDASMLFMEKLNNKLARMSAPQPMTQSDRLKEAHILEAKVVEEDEEDEE
ncbi:hypothetical protein LCGC14_0389960 [marine sediment metagenome]|uniref:Uncharacterized protein n=1 Tax=marine sediment metagenome TaxID=412755 RepID=A0A0F9T5M5_9ZZZZ